MTFRERIEQNKFQPSPERMLRHITKPFEYWDKSGVASTRKGPVPTVRGRWRRTGKDYADRIREKLNEIASTLGRSARK